MKIKLGVITLLMLPITFSCANNKAKVLDLFKRADMYDETGENLIGYTTFEYKNDLVSKTSSFNASGESIGQAEYTYDEHNNLVFSNIISEEPVQLKHAYAYDDMGRVTCDIYSIKHEGQEWKESTKYVYTYEEFKTSAVKYDFVKEWVEISKDEWLYDNKNRLIEEIHMNQKGTKTKDVTHEYDKYGCDIKITTVRPDQNAEQKECEYYKHLSNRPSKITIKNFEGTTNINMIEEYEYDKHLNVTLHKMYNASTPTKYVEFVRYSY